MSHGVRTRGFRSLAAGCSRSPTTGLIKNGRDSEDAHLWISAGVRCDRGGVRLRAGVKIEHPADGPFMAESSPGHSVCGVR